MKRDYNFYTPNQYGISLYKIDHWDKCYYNVFWAQYIAPKTRHYKKFKINNLLKNIYVDVMTDYTVFDELPFNMFIFNIGFFKNAIYIYNELIKYFER